MELNDKLNNKYNKDKAAYQRLENMKTTLKNLEKDLKVKTRAKEDAQIKQLRAKQDGDKKIEKDSKEEVEKLTDEIDALKGRISKMKEKLKLGKDKVDGYINELKKEPEFEAHMNSILEKRYNRKLNKLTGEKEQLDNIVKLCNEHPTLSNNLKGIIRSQEEYEKLGEELKKLDAKKDKARIDTIKDEMLKLKSKKEINTKSFMDYCGKNNINITKEYLEKLVSEKGFAHDKKDGSILLESSLKNIQKGYDKQIATYQKAIEKIPGADLSKFNESKDEKEEKSETEVEEKGIFKKLTDKIMNKEETENPENLPAPKFKWWEFRKRFNSWREERKASKNKKEQEENKESAKSKPSEKFRDAYKYDIVQDYINAQEKSIYKEASKEIRKSAQEKREATQKQKEDNEERE